MSMVKSFLYCSLIIIGTLTIPTQLMANPKTLPKEEQRRPIVLKEDIYLEVTYYFDDLQLPIVKIIRKNTREETTKIEWNDPVLSKQIMSAQQMVREECSQQKIYKATSSPIHASWTWDYNAAVGAKLNKLLDPRDPTKVIFRCGSHSKLYP